MAKLPALQYVRSGVSRGLSANASYREYQTTSHEQGLQGMRRQDYLRLYSQTRSLRDQASEAIQAPKDIIAGGLTPVERTTVKATGYGHWVGIYQRSRNGSDFYHTPFLVKSSRPITPAEAEQRAMDYLQTAPDEYDRVTLGVGFMGVEHFVPKQT